MPFSTIIEIGYFSHKNKNSTSPTLPVSSALLYKHMNYRISVSFSSWTFLSPPHWCFLSPLFTETVLIKQTRGDLGQPHPYWSACCKYCSWCTPVAPLLGFLSQRRCRLTSGTLAWAWPSSGYHRHWGMNQQLKNLSPVPSLHLFQ